MQDIIDLSVIVPIKNIEDHVDAVFKAISEKLSGLSFEILATDICSTDNSVLSALNSIKEQKLNGSVIKCGSDIPGYALNCAIDKAHGKYITFVFPRKLFLECIADYYKDAVAKDSEFIFGTAPSYIKKDVIIYDDNTALDVFDAVTYGKLTCDIASLMILAESVREKKIYFSETLKYGYSEDFIYKALIKCDKISVSSAKMKRTTDYEAPKATSEPTDEKKCFERIENILSLRSILSSSNANYKHMYNVIMQEKLPSCILSCVDTLLKEKYTVSAIKNALRSKGYDEYIYSGRYTSRRLKRRIILWKLAPHLYK